MKSPCQIKVGNIEPPIKNKELATLCWLLSLPSGRQILEHFTQKPLAEEVSVVVHSNPDDPPDLSAFGCGIEVTEFPPTQSMFLKCYEERGGKTTAIPPLQKTSGKMTAFRQEAIGRIISNELNESSFFSLPDEIAALEKAFQQKLEEKDKPGNEILLLENRSGMLSDFVITPAVARVVSATTPKHIKLIVLVRNKECIEFPFQPS